jgi:phosphoribosylaminoimidazolecarboxamide formyltransferase/IMP cyclohydrolase
VKEAYLKALAGDPVSAFGGVLISNKTIDSDAASEINNLFCEVVIAPAYQPEALEILKSKSNRIILEQKGSIESKTQVRSLLNGHLVQDKDIFSEKLSDLKTVTQKVPDSREMEDLLYAVKIVKHTKSNAIVLVKDKQLVGIGTGMTSRIDALRHAIAKSKEAGLSLTGAAMASDAFFPFPDCVEMANLEGIASVVQPGGSIRDKESIAYCDAHNMSMVTTGIRHFKH